MKCGQLIIRIALKYCHQMSQLKAKMHQIRSLASVRLSVCLSYMEFDTYCWNDKLCDS